uniref:Uncharacterized protein n=1 Tax=Onchocerca volvulus TaxID=6282 RepID=A0A8R1TQE1_ONCVO
MDIHNPTIRTSVALSDYFSMHCAAVATCGYMDFVSRQFGTFSLKRDSMIDPCARRFRILFTR